MTKAVILGAGVMGCALAIPLAENGVSCAIVGTEFDREIVESMRVTGAHPGLGVALPSGTEVFQVDDIARAFEGARIVIVGVASIGADWAAEQLGRHLEPNAYVLSVTKGMQMDENGSLRPLLDLMGHRLSERIARTTTWFAICGPSIAAEVAHRIDTAVVFAGKNRRALGLVAEHFETDRYHVRTSLDVLGSEVCAATKNLFAFGVGYGQGLGALEQDATEPPSAELHSVNLGAALFSQAHREMKTLVGFVGGFPETVDSLGGVGDLFVTSTGGRNVRAGRFVGGGATLAELKNNYMSGETIEGLEVLRVVGQYLENESARGNIGVEEFPFARFLYDKVILGEPAELPWRLLF